MPTVNVSKELLFKKIGQTYSDEEFDELCFQFGIELDEVGTEVGETIYKIDIPANRYDLLCVEGIALALRIFLQKTKPPIYKTIKPDDNVIKSYVKASTKGLRPFLVTAVLRAVKIDQPTYTSLLDLQEKLHHNICRKRALVAIGVHDLSKITPPFTYSCSEPSSIVFKPLNQTKEFSAVELMEFYKADTHLKPYLGIISGFDLYPVIRDIKGEVLSMPPIINGDLSKLVVGKGNEKVDLFIECTATDLKKAVVVLDTLVTMLSANALTEFVAETTEVIYEDGETFCYPELAYRQETISVHKANQIIGIQSSSSEIKQNLEKMSLGTKFEEKETLKVTIPPTRHDIIHACDLYEDIAISYGYDNIVPNLPPTMTIAKQEPLNKLTDLLRLNIAMGGFTETLTFSLCSIEDECEKVRIKRESRLNDLTLISNPKTYEFQTARYSMLPGLLKTIQANKKMPLPIKLFEINDVVRRDSNTDTGTGNIRNVCAVYYNKTPGFEQIHGLLDRLMELLEVNDYKIVECDNPTYFDGRCANIFVKGKVIGVLGVLHPQVLDSFELVNPASAFEFCLEGFL